MRHPYLFYPSPPIVNSLARVGLPHTATMENRKLAVDLAHLVIAWEQERIRRTRARTGVPPSSAGSVGSSSSSGGGSAAREPAPLKRTRPNESR